MSSTPAPNPPEISTFPGHARDPQGVVALGRHGPSTVRAVHLIVHGVSVIVGEIDPVDVLGARWSHQEAPRSFGMDSLRWFMNVYDGF